MFCFPDEGLDFQTRETNLFEAGGGWIDNFEWLGVGFDELWSTLILPFTGRN